LARFICPSFFWPDSNSFWRKYSVAGHVKFMAEKCGAYWLIDEIALAQAFRATRQGGGIPGLETTESTATLTCDDGNGNVVLSKRIPFTDFPLDTIDLWVEGGVILLPSEH
ncbi:DUF6876 family protein, partial [Bradyrhizobium sp. UFLA05-153]